MEVRIKKDIERENLDRKNIRNRKIKKIYKETREK